MLQILKTQLRQLKEHFVNNEPLTRKAQFLYVNGSCQMLTHAANAFEILINDEDDVDVEVTIVATEDERVGYVLNGKPAEWDSYGIAAILQIIEELNQPLLKPVSGKSYTREGMIKRVMQERRAKATKANYRITYADNIYGEHTLINEKGAKYKVTLRDFENETGYIDNPDLQTNKLGTTKHLMYAFQAIKADQTLFDKLSKTYPFVEIYLDPVNEYRITWHYPHPLRAEIAELIRKYFGTNHFIEPENVRQFLPFIREASDFKSIKIRPEVEAKIQREWDQEMLRVVSEEEQLDYSLIKGELFPYQKEGVKFATFKSGAILADEMGLGKTIQSIATAVMKKKLFGFKRTLIICPASLKEQWRQEITKFSNETAVIVEGFPAVREDIYQNTDAYFVILNYETVMRDWKAINRMDTDFIILDEAQKIKNFSTATAQSIKLLEKKHALVITGTPIENRLTDLYSIVQFVDPAFLSPLWEFSYQHCYFDTVKQDKITGYYNLQNLNERLKSILLRREKRKVIRELPQITEITVPVSMHEEQRMQHASFAHGISKILGKKFISPFDLQRLMLLMNSMRMVCDSTFLIDKETEISPKLAELKDILLEKLDIKNSGSKIIIFSEWVTMLQLIGKLLPECGIGFAQLSGKVAVKNRNALVKKFETDPNCSVFLSTEAGGSGLNLQVADTVINFEVPWNPAKKNQRIGRIDRLGQRSKHLNVINLITKDSIELKIASGLGLKQNLFDGVLNADNNLDVVDFSAAGKAQFLQQIEEMVGAFTTVDTPEDETIEDALNINEDVPQEEEIAELSEAEVDESLPAESAVQFESPGQRLEQVMNHGLEFLSGLFKMATGNAAGLEGRKMEFDKETGEVVMRFKLPV